MARRPITDRVRCAEPGCPEVSWREYDTQREAREARLDQDRRPFRCTRHANPDQVLSEGNLERTHVLVSGRVKSRDGQGLIPGLYWIPEGGQSGSGLSWGPGFKAFAKDFPEGTRLVITARIEQPLAGDVELEWKGERT